MRFLTESLDTASLTLLVGTAHASYPLANLNSRIKTKQFRTASGSSTTPQIKIDFGATRTCDYIILGAKSFSGEFTLEVGAADNGSTFDIEVLVDISATPATTNIYQAFESSVTKRYWRVSFSSFANNAVDWLGLIFLGSKYETPREAEYNFGIGYDYSNIYPVDTNNYQLRYKLNERRKEQGGMIIRGYTEAQKDAFIAEFEDNCDGLLQPFFALEDDLSTYSYFHFAGNPFDFKKITKDFYENRISLLEQL